MLQHLQFLRLWILYCTQVDFPKSPFFYDYKRKWNIIFTCNCQNEFYKRGEGGLNERSSGCVWREEGRRVFQEVFYSRWLEQSEGTNESQHGGKMEWWWVRPSRKRGENEQVCCNRSVKQDIEGSWYVGFSMLWWTGSKLEAYSTEDRLSIKISLEWLRVGNVIRPKNNSGKSILNRLEFNFDTVGCTQALA